MSRRPTLVVVTAGLVLSLLACRKAPVAPPSSMVGHWAGTADVAVNWCNAKQLPIVLTINQNGSVIGTVGDATLKEGSIYPNPGRQPKALALPTKFVIEAALEGPLVKAEGIERPDICIPVEVNKDGQLAGAFLTSGKEYGDKSQLVFSGGLRPLAKTGAR